MHSIGTATGEISALVGVHSPSNDRQKLKSDKPLQLIYSITRRQQIVVNFERVAVVARVV
jgi:hypothetical protein